MLKQYTSVLRPFLALSTVAVLGLGSQANAVTILAPEVSALHAGNIKHCDTVVAGRDFTKTFECGDELFGTVFNAIDGVGINVGDGGHFTRLPRADLNGNGQWNRNVPARITGPNGQSCAECHNFPVEDGAGLINSNVIRDPQHGNAPIASFGTPPGARARGWQLARR
jgi:hypothetical protein